MPDFPCQPPRRGNCRPRAQHDPGGAGGTESVLGMRPVGVGSGPLVVGSSSPRLATAQIGRRLAGPCRVPGQPCGDRGGCKHDRDSGPGVGTGVPGSGLLGSKDADRGWPTGWLRACGMHADTASPHGRYPLPRPEHEAHRLLYPRVP